LLGHKKHTRKNVYKNSKAKRRESLARRMASIFKLTAGIAFLLSISLGLVLGHDFLTQCDYFKSESIVVTGNRRISGTKILKQAQISEGVNILSVNLSTARKRLLANSWIAGAEVRRKLPNEIHIRIEEQRPLAVLDLGRKFLINTRGEVFKEVSASESWYLPVVNGLEFSDIHISGSPTSMPFEAVMDVLQLGKRTESILPNRRIKKIHVDKEIGLTLYTPDQKTGRLKTIKLGYNDYPGKYKRLENLLLYIKEQHDFPSLESIDLKSSTRIVVSPSDRASSPQDHKEV
jgi:cell division protein FtsQ